MRVGIVEGADKAGNATLTGPGGTGGADIDRVVGFAGVYPDNNIPLGPIVQVRRDDSYRLLGASYNQKDLPKVQWRCAYYITKETPKQPTPPAPVPVAASAKAGNFTGSMSLIADEGNPDQPPAPITDPAATTDPVATTDLGATTDSATAGSSVDTPLNYDQLMDQNLPDDLLVAGKQWGGMVFGFTFAADVPDTSEGDTTALEPYSDSAINELENKEDISTE